MEQSLHNDSAMDEEYSAGLKREKEKQNSNKALDNIKKFYKDNEEICKEAYDYFQEFENNESEYILQPQFISQEEFKALLHPITILVITINPIENAVFLHWLKDRQKSPLVRYMVCRQSCIVSQLDNNRTIIHVHPHTTGENETRRVLNRVNKFFTPSYLIMLGICYGFNMESYSIGSVFLSDSIITFRLNFRDEINSDETRFEAEDEYDKAPDGNLIDAIKDYTVSMVVQSILNKRIISKTKKIEIGRFLSCNSLVSSRKVKQAVMDQYANRKPKPLGGEMEGAGILKSYMVEESNFTNWLILKSICDWGEKKNGLHPDPVINAEMKDSLQAFAMTNTCGAFEIISKVLR